MDVARDVEVPVRAETDIVHVRREAREFAREAGLSLVNQTKLVTAASELARNALVHGGGGSCRLEVVRKGVQVGVRMIFRDQGPGIANVEQALRDGFTTVGGLGLGLSGAKRLVNEFHIESRPGEGTMVTVIRWR